jgi:hypothetical protein
VLISIGELRARLHDASYGGCRIAAPAALDLAARESFHFTAQLWPMPLRAEIMWSRKSDDRAEHGVRLIETAFEALAMWKSSVDRWSSADYTVAE